MIDKLRSGRDETSTVEDADKKHHTEKTGSLFKIGIHKSVWDMRRIDQVARHGQTPSTADKLYAG